jgi:hypothetical protein
MTDVVSCVSGIVNEIQKNQLSLRFGIFVRGPDSHIIYAPYNSCIESIHFETHGSLYIVFDTNNDCIVLEIESVASEIQMYVKEGQYVLKSQAIGEIKVRDHCLSWLTCPIKTKVNIKVNDIVKGGITQFTQ